MAGPGLRVIPRSIVKPYGWSVFIRRAAIRLDDIIVPSSQVNESLILTEADNLQRIFASMALKTTTQSTLVRKLSSYARKNRTKKALWELDNIYMSLYVLNYIDDETLRRNVQRALNRGEAYHQLQRAITHPNGGRFRGTTEYDMAIESDCSRLIANAIIYYNIDLLSRLWAALKITRAGERSGMGTTFIARRLATYQSVRAL